MTTPIPYPMVQGVRHDHSSLDIKLNGISTIGIKSIDWSDSLEPGKVYGTSAQKYGETRGVQDATGSLELWLAEAQAFEQQLVEAYPGVGLFLVRFPIDIIVVSEGGLDPWVVHLHGARIKNRSFSSSSGGSDGLAKKYDLSLLYVIDNGIEPIAGLMK